jgi:lipooligosaccharide transport system permease protein
LPAVLVGLALAAATTAFTSRLESDQGLSSLFRFGIVPMFLFSGTFFPIEQLPDWLEWIAFLTPLYHAVELCRWVALGIDPAVNQALSVSYLLAWVAVGTFLSVTGFRQRLRV